MKKWENPEMEVLDLQNTLHGTKLTQEIDEVRVDDPDCFWWSYKSGAAECTNHYGPK